jgi:hypothetical protein
MPALYAIWRSAANQGVGLILGGRVLRNRVEVAVITDVIGQALLDRVEERVKRAKGFVCTVGHTGSSIVCSRVSLSVRIHALPLGPLSPNQSSAPVGRIPGAHVFGLTLSSGA